MTAATFALHLASALGAALLASICCFPITNFLQNGWKRKKQEITSAFSQKAKKLYLRKFFNMNSSNPDHDFEQIYEQSYSRSGFYGPLALLIAVLLPLMYVFSQTAVSHLLVNGHQARQYRSGDYGITIILPVTAASGLAGAYLWVVWDLAATGRRANFRPMSILLSALRLIVAVPVGYSIASLAKESIAPFMAFAISAFPIDQVRIILRRLASDKLGLTITSVRSKAK
jgi:hypothetical protein